MNGRHEMLVSSWWLNAHKMTKKHQKCCNICLAFNMWVKTWVCKIFICYTPLKGRWNECCLKFGLHSSIAGFARLQCPIRRFWENNWKNVAMNFMESEHHSSCSSYSVLFECTKGWNRKIFCVLNLFKFFYSWSATKLCNDNKISAYTFWPFEIRVYQDVLLESMKMFQWRGMSFVWKGSRIIETSTCSVHSHWQSVWLQWNIYFEPFALTWRAIWGIFS